MRAWVALRWARRVAVHPDLVWGGYMREREIADALALDRHFTEAGFSARP